MGASANRPLAADNPRRYGEPPYGVAVVHGGPGAPGEMAPVARELCRRRGVLEPLQTRATLAGQVAELKSLLEEHGDPPLVLIGHSWGAILSFVYAAENPASVKKLILVGSGAFADAYVEKIKGVRLSRLSPAERKRMDELLRDLNDPAVRDKDKPFAEMGEIIAGADSYDPLPHASDVIAYQHGVFAAVWREAERLRRSGELLRMGRRIACPVVAVHGDYDPHPREGIEIPLAEVLGDFRFVPLERCGHKPWYERWARKEFFGLLEREIAARQHPPSFGMVESMRPAVRRGGMRMKTLVAYFSQTGKTKLVAEAIYGCIEDEKELKTLDEVESLEGYDLAFIGFPIIAFGPAREGRDFLEQKAAGRKVALFVTHAAPEGQEGLGGWLDKCREAAASAELVGFFDCQGELSEAIADALMKSDDPMLRSFGERRPETIGQPDETRLQRARDFAREVMGRL